MRIGLLRRVRNANNCARAYEISTLHNKEPPPPSILEDVSAKGGDLLNRTVENYFPTGSRESDRVRNGESDSEESDDNGEPKKTPKLDRMDVDEPGSTGRVTRGLRHAPPQRVLFQPEATPVRQTRTATGALQSPQPGSQSNGVYGQSLTIQTVMAYEPRPAIPVNLKPVVTPSNNPQAFRKQRQNEMVNRKNRPIPMSGMMLPGTGFPGPNIYIRALHALRSREPEEEAYALHHLVKISHERGDKYRFDQFPGLAEALVAKVIEVASIFYDVKFDISFVEEELEQPNTLNGLSGTPDLLQRIQSFEKLDFLDDLLPEETAKSLEMVTEAALIIRNMVMLHENAQFVSMIPSVRDLVVVVLNLPKHATVVELQHYALEIAEQLTRFWTLDAQNPLYLSLLSQVDSEDRGKIITSLRGLGRIAMNLEATNKLTNVPRKTLQSICDWLLVEDEELRNACLDFLYLFTGFVDNVEMLANEVDVEGLVNQLVRLLQYNAIAYEERRSNTKSSKSSQSADSAPKLSAAIIEHLVTLEEPERSSQWLRTCFEEDASGEITQIQLWSAYNAAFQDVMATNQSFKALMPAKDFITNVSTTFASASAQVLNIGGQPKYTIKGIRPRSVPVDPATKKPYMRCWWHPPSLLNGYSDTKHSTTKIECGEFTSGAKAMWEHVLSVHLQVPRDENGKWVLEQKPDIDMANGDVVSATVPSKFFCHWGGCTHFNPSGTESAYEAGQHIKTHLPDTSLMHSIHAKHNRTPSTSTPLVTSAQARHENFQPQFGTLGGRYNQGYSLNHNSTTVVPQQPGPNFRYYNTATDEAQDAAGLPLASVLVLRNLARQLGKLNPPPQIEEVADSPTSTHKRTHSESSPDRRRSTGAKKPRLSDAAREAHQRENEEIEKEEQEAEKAGWVPRIFAPVKEQLYFVSAHNLTLRNYMGGLFKAITDGGG
jgi:chromatin structure-remodeling complex subunit RSC9